MTTQAPPGPGARRPRERRKLPTGVLALIVFGLVIGALVAGFAKPQLTTLFMQLTGSETRTLAFEGNRFLVEDASDVKLAGVDVGVVDKVEPGPEGGAIVTVVVPDEVVEAVGSAPSARMRPTTLLSGVVYIELIPGGDRTVRWEDPVPVERTRMPVEVDSVIEAFQPDALAGATAAVTQFDATLDQGGTDALKSLLANAPDTLRPGAGVIEGLLGERPDVDLQQLVTGLQSASAVLTRTDGQLEDVIRTLQDTSRVFADTSAPVAQAIDRLPSALDSADAGLLRLDASLDKLGETAGPARPTVQELDVLLERIEPVLADARPVVNDLRFALEDTRPLVQDLVPAADGLTAVSDDLGAPLERLNGPVLDAVYAPYQGEGPYQNTRSDNPLFQELGYMFSGLARVGDYVDANGHMVAFNPGGGTGSLSAPVGEFSLEAMYQQLFHGANR
jgi:phospholipid/cholesterol/gamma-HCH transport system substrate-binding protein